MPDTLSREGRWIEIIARALPDIPSEDTHRYVYGDDVPYLDAAEEWYTSPREMARQMVGPILAHIDTLTAAVEALDPAEFEPPSMGALAAYRAAVLAILRGEP